MPHSNVSVAPLVAENLALLNELDMTKTVLDLACGNGRNGLFLVENNIPVTFADNNEAALDEISKALRKLGNQGDKSSTWLIDFENEANRPLEGKNFDAILVFNYLHRPLMGDIKNALRPGGLLFYETFTEAQRQFGRPRNPDFLLKEHELRQEFRDWDILFYYEGEMPGSTESGIKAAASLLARKP